ncbi:Pkinase-domain-containing protein [Neoconidiobolus thromboides FSU 785]|nr:Pkinase-domain-containing protein [Neoconidiobolus thromboides FSU 785]
MNEYIKKLTSEFCISSTLHHPNVVETVDLIKDEAGDWCQVMEYCPGGDLYSVIRNGQMSRHEIDCCFKQLILGLQYIHSMGVAHRDIKPENLLIDYQGRIKITDFGVSDVFRMVWETTCHRSAGLCGSEPYIPPEAFVEKDYDGRSMDIWATGIVYYAMSYNGVPFRTATKNDSNYKAFLETRLNNKYEPFKRYSPGCRELMKRILEPEPSKRITIDEILNNEWFQSIEVCENCETSTMHHNHFSSNYIPRKAYN